MLATIFKGHYKLTLAVVFRERRVLLMSPIVDLRFLYSKLSLKSSTGNIP